MSLELLNRRDDDVAWLDLARSSNVSEEVARVLWARARAEAGNDPIRAERTFKRLLDDTQAIEALARELEAHGNGGLLDPGKWTRVLDLSSGAAPATTRDESGVSAATRLAKALETAVLAGEKQPQTESASVTEALRKFAKSDVGRMIGSVDNGGMHEIIRVVDALVTIVEHDKAQREGKPLPTSIRAELEDKLNIDFSDVRVHHDAAAATEANRHGAVAFARGKDVYFADGAYDPSSSEGKQLIAHEATHVAQQRGGGRAGDGAMSAPGSAVEREADRVAAAFGAGAARGSARLQISERASAGTISRKEANGNASGGDGGKPTKWKPKLLLGQVLDLGDKLKDATDGTEGKKEIKLDQSFGPLKIVKATFKADEAGEKIESGTLHAAVDAGIFKGTTGELKVDKNEGVSGKVNVPINAAGMFAKEVSLEARDGEITAKVRLDISDFKSPMFPVKHSDIEISVTSKGDDITAKLLGTADVEIKNGIADGKATLNIDLDASKKGVSFNAHMAGKITVAGLGEAGASIFWNGEKLTFEAGGTVPIKIPGLAGNANIKYEAGNLSLSSDDLAFTLPKLAPVKFKSVELGNESKIKAELSLDSPIDIPLTSQGANGPLITLENSTIAIEGKKVNGALAGSFALNNEGGFKAGVNLQYANGKEDGGLHGSVHVEGGVHFKVGGVDVSIDKGTTLDVTKNEAGFDVAGQVNAKAKVGSLPPIEVQVIAAKGQPIDLKVDTTIPLNKVSKFLGGDCHVTYHRAAGANEFSFDATDVKVMADPISGQILFSQLAGSLKGKELTGTLTAATGTVIPISKGSKNTVTLQGGTIELLPGGKLDGHIKASGDSEGGSHAEASVGWTDGQFDFAAEGDFELGGITGHQLEGSVHASAASGGHGSFVSNGDIKFGNDKLKDIRITHLEGNRKDEFYTATISAHEAINKAVGTLPVEVTTAEASAQITYNKGKFGVAGQLSGTAKYPKDAAEPQVEGTFSFGVDEAGQFTGSIDNVNVKAGGIFESSGGSINMNSGDVTPGVAHFKIKGFDGTLNEGTVVNVKDKKFNVDLDVTPTSGPLKGVQFNALVTNTGATASIKEDTPPIQLGKFASLTITNESKISIGKNVGVDATLVGSVIAKDVGEGTFRVHYAKNEGVSGEVDVTVKPIAMFAETKIGLAVDNDLKVSTKEHDGIVLQLASKYTEKFDANAKIKIDKNVFNVEGNVTEIKNLGAVSDAFREGKGAKVEWHQGHGVSVHAGIEMSKVIPQLAQGSLLTLEYAGGIFTVTGTLKPSTYGPVVFDEASQVTASWTSKGGGLVVDGEVSANIANLCKASMRVSASKGGGKPGEFYLDGNLDATDLSNKIPSVHFTSTIATFGVAIGGEKNAKPDINFDLTATVDSIAGFHLNGMVNAKYATGQGGMNGKINVWGAKLGPVIADGEIAIEKNKFKSGSLHLMADFPTLKIEGTGEVLASEMGGLNTKANLTVTPSAESAIGKFVQSGSIDVELQKWKVHKALGTLNLVPPSFLPLEKPIIEVGYEEGKGMHAKLSTTFPAPMAKNGEKGNFEVGYTQEGGRGLYAHVDFPIQVPGFKVAVVTGDLDKTGVKIGVDLFPKNDGLVKKARVEVGYNKETGFYVMGSVRLKPTETLELEVSLTYDHTGLHVGGIEPDDKEATSDMHELARWDKKFPTIPLLTVGVASLGLKFGMGISAGYRMPKMTFKNPKLEGGLDALDSGGMPAFTFGGSIVMGAYLAFSLSVQVVGEIQLLIVTASAGIGAELTARLDLDLGANVDGRYAPGEGAKVTIDPFVSARLDLIAALIATLYAEIGWWTILDKKWTLAETTFASIPLGSFKPFKPVGLAFGGPQGTRLTDGMHLADDALDQVKDGVSEGGKKSADAESNKETADKLRPVLQSFKSAAPQFVDDPPMDKPMTAAPVDFGAMFPGVDDDQWDVYQDHADQAEDMVPELRMNTPVEKLAKAVAVLARKNPIGAGRLILGWRRCQIAAKGINPDTGLDVVNERLVVQALIDEKFEKDTLEAQEKQRLQTEEHEQHVQKQTTDYTKAETSHVQVGVQQQIAHDQNVSKIQTEWNKAQDKKATAGKAAANEGAAVKPVQQDKAPPPPKPALPPKPAPLAKPTPIPVPPPIPLPPQKEVLPAVTMPALPADPGVSVKAAGVIPAQQKKAEVKQPAAKEPPKGNVPDPKPGATSQAKSVGGGGSPMPDKGSNSSGQGPQVGGTTSAAPPPGPKVAAGPDGIISQNKTLDDKHSKYDPSFKGAGGGKPGILGGLFGGGGGDKPPPGAPAPGGKDAKPGPGVPGGDAAKKDPKAGAKGPALDPTVQKVVDQGKANEQKQKQALDNQKKTYDSKVQQNNKQTDVDVKKLDAAGAQAKKKKEDDKKAAATAANAPAAAAPKAGDPKDPKDAKPKGPIGVRVTIDILGEPHTLYIDEKTGMPMVDPPPTPVGTKLADLKGQISGAPPSIKGNATSTESAAEALEKQLEELTKKAMAGDAGAKSEVAGKEQALAESLKVTWAWAKVAADPAVSGGSIEKPLTHPYFVTFKGRIQHLNDLGHLTVDVGPFAEGIWTKICEAVKRASPQLKDPQAYSNFAKGWLNMQSPQFQAAIKELDAIGTELAKAGSSAFAKSDSFGFWSKEEGRTLAEHVSGLTLETSAIGTLMDGLPTLDGKSAGWDPEIWGALSNAYAMAVVPEVIKGKKIKVCIGAGVPAGNIWDAVESVALKHGLKQAGLELEHHTTNYAAAALSKADRRNLNETKVTQGIKGCLFVGDRAGAIAAADAYWKTCPDTAAAPAKTKPVVTPPVGAPTPAGAQPPKADPAVADPKQPKQPTAAAPTQPAVASPVQPTGPKPNAPEAAPAKTSAVPDTKPPEPVHLQTAFTAETSHKITTDAKPGEPTNVIISSTPMSPEEVFEILKALQPFNKAEQVDISTAAKLNKAVKDAAEKREKATTPAEQKPAQAALEAAQDNLGKEVARLLKIFEKKKLRPVDKGVFKATGEPLRLVVHKAVETITDRPDVKGKIEEVAKAKGTAKDKIQVTAGAGIVALGKGMAQHDDPGEHARINYKMPDGGVTQERRGTGEDVQPSLPKGNTYVLNKSSSGPAKQDHYHADSYKRLVAILAGIKESMLEVGFTDPKGGAVGDWTIATVIKEYIQQGKVSDQLKRKQRQRINELVLLLFGREAARDSGVTAFTPMSLSLIETRASTFENELFKPSEQPSEDGDGKLGGGNHPSTFKGAFNDGMGPVKAAEADALMRGDGQTKALTPKQVQEKMDLSDREAAALKIAVKELRERETKLAQTWLQATYPSAWGYAFFVNEAACHDFVVDELKNYYGLDFKQIADHVEMPAAGAAPPPPPQAASAQPKQAAPVQPPPPVQAAPVQPAPPAPKKQAAAVSPIPLLPLDVDDAKPETPKPAQAAPLTQPITQSVTAGERKASLIADPKTNEVYLDLGAHETLSQGTKTLAEALPENERANATAIGAEAAPIKKEMTTPQVAAPTDGPAQAGGSTPGGRIKSMLTGVGNRIANVFRSKPAKPAPYGIQPTPTTTPTPTGTAIAATATATASTAATDKATPTYAAFKTAVGANDATEADRIWGKLSKTERLDLDGTVMVQAINSFGAKALTYFKDATHVFNAPIVTAIFTKMDADMASWVAAFKKTGQWDEFLEAKPKHGEVTEAQAKTLDKAMMEGAPNVTGVFQKVYPDLKSNGLPSSWRYTSTKWPDDKIRILFHALTLWAPVKHVQTAHGGFFLVSHYTVDTPKGPEQRVMGTAAFGGGFFVMPASAEHGDNHDMAGGNDREALGKGKTYDAADGDMSQSKGHWDLSALHEIGHGVGEASGGNTWAHDETMWEDSTLDALFKPPPPQPPPPPPPPAVAAVAPTGPTATTPLVVDNSVTPAPTTPAPTGAGSPPAATPATPATPAVPAGPQLSNEAAKNFMISKVMKPSEPGKLPVNITDEAEVVRQIEARFTNSKLYRYYHQRLANQGADEYQLVTPDINAEGIFMYAVLRRYKNGSVACKYRRKFFDHRVSAYSTASPHEWFAEQYVQYYRTEKRGTGLEPETKAKLDEYDQMHWDPGTRTLGTTPPVVNAADPKKKPEAAGAGANGANGANGADAQKKPEPPPPPPPPSGTGLPGGLKPIKL